MGMNGTPPPEGVSYPGQSHPPYDGRNRPCSPPPPRPFLPPPPHPVYAVPNVVKRPDPVDNSGSLIVAGLFGMAIGEAMASNTGDFIGGEDF